ncbi:DUF6161 domain-containing protein [uncultured Chryseobacterium sp.]|uniref:DUF6161 domain-containing protein n=1 Tax=uncultured Chryseobacterium sp. TaxID=259322 RepID=UPI0025E30423|nr:DUF6161 domain-containing protein [uncultured Chryseobacterium sp.]
MNLTEVRLAIRNYPYIEKVNERELSITFNSSDQQYHFTGLYNIFKFFYDQNEKWKADSFEDVNSVFEDSKSFFENAIANLEHFIKFRIVSDQVVENDFDRYFQELESYHLNPSNSVFIFDAPEVAFLQNIAKKNINLLVPAYKYLTDSSLITNNRYSFQGYVLAYEFQNKENSVLFNHRETEKKHLSRLRSDLTSLTDTYENEVNLFQNTVIQDYKNYKLEQDNYISKSRKILAEWLLVKKNNFNSLLDASKIEIENLQNQYSELLKLQEPVKYWKDRAIELNKKADKMMWVLGAITLLAVVLTYILLWFTPKGMLESIFKGDTTAAIRWSIVFALFISFIAFMFRAVMKFMFSNYHLARDAEEREKLTYLYISLLTKGEFSEEEKKIVFQALFSRSDTGLLKDDSSPTMPGVSAVIEKFR